MLLLWMRLALDSWHDQENNDIGDRAACTIKLDQQPDQMSEEGT